MTALTDRQLFDAGLATDVVLGFRRAMKCRVSTPTDAVEMPEHFFDEGRGSRRDDFRCGVEIARSWRALRTVAGVARRESRNRDFKDVGMAYAIDRHAVRLEAVTMLRQAIASVDGFSLPKPEIVHAVVEALDLVEAEWDDADRIGFYDPDGENGILTNLFPVVIRAKGETWASPEALYQSQKHGSYDLQDRIRLAPDPLAAKAVAKAHGSERRRDWPRHRIVAMVRTLVLRAEQDDAYRAFLLESDDRMLVEDTTHGNRDLFWGAADDRGVNALGRIHMAIRGAMRSGTLPPRPRREPNTAQGTNA